MTSTPNLHSIDSVLSPDECRSLIERGEKLGFEPSETCCSCVPTRTGIRNNDRVEFADKRLAAKLWLRCKSGIPEQIDGDLVVGLNSTFRFYRYQIGHSFKPHTDNPLFPDRGLRTHLTCLFYLNSDFEEGETVFYNEKKLHTPQVADFVFKPRVGSALFFEHDWWHEGRAPKMGTKYALRTDVVYAERVAH